MAFTGEKLMQGIDSYVSKAISRLSYNTTELCTVSKVNDDGSYQVTNGTVSFKAWGGNEKYTEKDSVYVLVPNGTHDAECMILRKKTTDQDIKVQRESPKDNIAIIGDNLIDLGDAIKLENRGLREDDFTRHRLDRLYIKFKSYAETSRNAASPSSVLSQGSYIIQFKIDTTDGQTIMLDIPSEELEGNLFASQDAATYQEMCWGINYDKILQAMLFENTDLYQDIATGEIKIRSDGVSQQPVPAINLIPVGFSTDVIYGSGVDAYGNAVSNINSGSTAITINVELEEIYFGIDPNSFEGTQIDIWWTDEEGRIRWEEDGQVYIADKESYSAEDWTEDPNGNLAKWYAQACIYYKDPETGTVTRIGNEQEILDFQKEVQLKWYINDSTMYKVTDDPTSEAGWLLLENERELNEDIAEAINNNNNITDKEKSLEASKKLQNTLKFAFTLKKNLVYYLRTLQLRAAVYVDKVAQDGYSNILNVNNDDYDLHGIISQEDGFNIQAEDNYNGKFFVYQLDGNLIQDFDNDIRYLNIFYNNQNIYDWALQNLEINDTIELNWTIIDSKYIINDKKTNNIFKFRKNDNFLFEKFVDETWIEVEDLLRETRFYYKLINQLFEQISSVTVTCILKQNDKIINNIPYTIYLGQDSASRSGVNFQILPENNRRPVVIEDGDVDNVLKIKAILFKDGIDITNKINAKNLKWSWEYPKNKNDLYLDLIDESIINNIIFPFENSTSSLILNNYNEVGLSSYQQKHIGYSNDFLISQFLINKDFKIEIEKQLLNFIEGAQVTDITISIEEEEDGQWQPLSSSRGTYNSNQKIFTPAVAGLYRIKFDFSGNTGFAESNDFDCSTAIIDIQSNLEIVLQNNDINSNVSNLLIEIDNSDEDYDNLGILKNRLLKKKNGEELGYIFRFSNKTDRLIKTVLKKNERANNVEHFQGVAHPGDNIIGFGYFTGDFYESVNYDCYIDFQDIENSKFYFHFNNFNYNKITKTLNNIYYMYNPYFYFENQILNYIQYEILGEASCLNSSEFNETTTSNFVSKLNWWYNSQDNPFVSCFKIYYREQQQYQDNSLVLSFSFEDLINRSGGDWINPTENASIYYYEDIENFSSFFQNIPTVILSSLKIKNEQILKDSFLYRIITPMNISDENKKQNNYHILKAELEYQKEKLTAYLPIGYCNINALNKFNQYYLSNNTNYYYSLDNNILKNNQQFKEFKLLNLNESDIDFEMFLKPQTLKDMSLPSITGQGDVAVPNFKITEVIENNKIISYKVSPCKWYDENNEVSLLIEFRIKKQTENEQQEIEYEEYFWIQPLFQIRNSNFSTIVNSWSGETEVDPKSVKTPLGIFGSKNNYNRFTGLILGEMPLLEGYKDYSPGIYGYKSLEDKTENTFYINTEGNAYLKGTVIARDGEIGGLTLKEGKLYNNSTEENQYNKWYGISTRFNKNSESQDSIAQDRKNLIETWGDEYFLVAGAKYDLNIDDGDIKNWKITQKSPKDQPNFFVSDQGSLYAQQANLFPSTIRFYNEKEKDLTYKENKNTTWISLGEWIQIEYEMVELMRWLEEKRKSNTLLYFFRQLIDTSDITSKVYTNDILLQSNLKVNRSIDILKVILKQEFKWDGLKIKYANVNFDQIIMSSNSNLVSNDEQQTTWSAESNLISSSSNIIGIYPNNNNILIQTEQSPKDRYFNKLSKLLNLFKLNNLTNKKIEIDSSVSVTNDYEYDFGYADMNFREWDSLFSPSS